VQRDAARELWAKGGGYNPACNTRGVVTMEADLKTLLSSTITYIGSVLDHGARTATHMTMLMRAFDEQKAAAVGGAGGGADAKKRSLEEALGEIRDECRAKLRKANGEPNVEVVGEAV
jgi:hypothetical protein